MKLVTDYINYFETLCTQHKKIEHNPNDKSNKVFLPISMIEAMGDFRSGMRGKDYAFRLINYTVGLNDNYASNALKNHEGGFILTCYHKKSDYEDFLSTLENCERIALEFIERMVYDSKNGHELFYHSLNTIQGINLSFTEYANDLTYSGVIVTFPFSNFFENCINTPRSNWNDL